MSKFHGKVVGQVLETKDYSIFKQHSDNRVIRPNHVKRLVEKMKNKGWLKSSTIIVNQKFQIIDGHHRMLAAIETKVPVRYEIVVGATGDDITELNSTQLKWSPFDHIEKYVKRGNQHYINLKNFIAKYPMFKLTECAMLCKNNFSATERTVFEEGRWESRNMNVATGWAESLLSLKPYFPKGYNKAIFVRAMVKIFSKKSEFDFNQFLHKVELRPGMIHLCGSVELYIEMIEEIYNYKRRDKINLRF